MRGSSFPAEIDETPSTLVNKLPGRDPVLLWYSGQGEPPSDTDRSDVEARRLRTRRTRLFFQIALIGPQPATRPTRKSPWNAGLFPKN